MLRIVAIDDNPAEFILLEQALERVSVPHFVEKFYTAESAFSYLRLKSEPPAFHYPQLILLDISLPGRSGLELLHDLKADADLQPIPVIMISTSADPQDVKAAYDLHASCYIVKRLNAEDHVNALLRMITFWVRTAQFLPERGFLSGTPLGLSYGQNN